MAGFTVAASAGSVCLPANMGCVARPISTDDWARVPVCGLVAAHNASGLPPGPDRLGLLVGTLLRQRVEVQGCSRPLRQRR